MITDPGIITRDQQRAAYLALGLDPDLFNITNQIIIGANDVEVIRGAGNIRRRTKIPIGRQT